MGQNKPVLNRPLNTVSNWMNDDYEIIKLKTDRDKLGHKRIDGNSKTDFYLMGHLKTQRLAAIW